MKNKVLDTSKLAKIIKIAPEFFTPYKRKVIEETIVKIEKINFVYSNGDVAGLFIVIESNKLPKNLSLVLPRAKVENI